MASLTDVGGLKVGHYSDYNALTGCTVILAEKGAVAGVDVRGSAPGTRETDLLNPINKIDRVHAVLLTGGSAYGLDAATGVMKFLEEKNIGFNVGAGVVPIVPTAVLFDLHIGNPQVRPDAKAGYLACQNASAGPVEEGNVGAGTGATVGKLLGPEYCMRGGLGSWSHTLPNGVVIGALVAVNSFGDVRDHLTNQILAGTRSKEKTQLIDSLGQMLAGFDVQEAFGTNTTIGVVATNAKLDKTQATKVAQMAQDGLARSITPVHTMFDGDTIFALSTGELEMDINTIGTVAAYVLAEAVKRAIINAVSVDGVPSYRHFFQHK
ncbi:MAG TPA: P1 family peptidase [Clostridia bacterium]|jgi:L-aminopeptidase/D-esterase-like protein|nr:P1 family peptidase [Clostridia bacterium]